MTSNILSFNLYEIVSYWWKLYVNYVTRPRTYMYYSMNQCEGGKSRIGVAQEHAVNIYIKIQYNIKLKSKMINIIKCNQSFKKRSESRQIWKTFCLYFTSLRISYHFLIKLLTFVHLCHQCLKILYASIQHYWVIRHIHDVFWCWRVTEYTLSSFGAIKS